MTVVVGLSRILAFLVAGLMAVLLAVQAPDANARAPIVFHLRFGLRARGVSAASVSGPYLGFTRTTSTRTRTVERFVLLDDRTGKRLATPADCDAGVVGDPWVALYCSSSSGSSYKAFNARTRKLRRLPCHGLCQQDYYLQNLVAVGAKWFEVEVEPHESCGDGEHYTCGPTTMAFYNTRTGQQKVPLVNNSETVDLNAPTLTRPLCAPLREPPGYSPTTFGGPTLALDGSFAIAQEPSGVFLERCGRNFRLPLATAPYEGSLIVSPRAAAFCSSTIEGYLLPSLRPFTISAAPYGCPLLLGSRHAYEIASGQLWAAPLPRQLQDLTRTKPRHHTTSTR